MNKPAARGGARPGAGRPPKADALKKLGIALTQEQIDWVESVGREASTSFSETVRKIIDHAMRAARRRGRR